MQFPFCFDHLTFHIVILCSAYLLDASFCGKSGVPYSFEVLPSGAPVLGCAQPSCVISRTAADEPGTVVEDSEFLTDANGQADGFFRDGDRASKRFRHTNAPRLITNCSGSFSELSCPRKNQWVGGIEYIDHPRQPLILQCCTFDGLRFSQEVGSTTVGPGEAITGGEVIRNGRQISFDVIANVKKIVKSSSSSSSKVNYEVTVRRMNCLPDPPEPEVQFDQDVPAEVFKVLSSASNKDLATTNTLERKTEIIKQEKKVKVKQQAARTEQLPEISGSTKEVEQAKLPPPKNPYHRQLPSRTPITPSGAASNHNFVASMGPVRGYQQQTQQYPQPIAVQQPINTAPIYQQQQQPPLQTPPNSFQQPQYPQHGGFASPPPVTPAPLETTTFHTFAPLAIHTFPTHTFPTHTFPTLPTHTFPTHTFPTYTFPTHTFHPFPTFAPLFAVTPAPGLPAAPFSPDSLSPVQPASSGVVSSVQSGLEGSAASGAAAFAAPSVSKTALPLPVSGDSSATAGSLTPLASDPSRDGGSIQLTGTETQQQIRQQVSQSLQPQPAGSSQLNTASPAPFMMMGVPAMGTILEALQGPNYHPITMPGLGVVGYSNSATKK